MISVLKPSISQKRILEIRINARGAIGDKLKSISSIESKPNGQ